MNNNKNISQKPYYLQCQACGSTDVEVDTLYYSCKYCHTKHLLPLKYVWVMVFQKNLKRISIIFFSLLALFVTFWFYYPKSTTPIINSKKISQNSVVKDEIFPNIVFSYETFKNILTLKRTNRHTYLVAGEEMFGAIRVMEFSATGKKLWSRVLGKGFYIDLLGSQNGDTVITYHQSGVGETIKLSSSGKIIYKKQRYYSAIAECNSDIICVNGGMVERVDAKGDTVWSNTIDSKKYISKAGRKLDPNKGVLVPYSKSFNRLNLKYIVKLKDNNYASVGIYNRSQLAIVIVTPNGKLVEYKKFDFGKIYIDDVISTDDGGLAMVARRGLRFFKFNSNGDLLTQQKVLKQIRNVYNYAIVQNSKGYMITSSVGKNASLQTTQIDSNGNRLDVHTYKKESVRLHPVKLVKAYGSGYLMAVTTEIHEPWIVKVLDDGTMDANLNNPSLGRNVQSDQKSLSAKNGGDIFSSSRTFKDGYINESKKSVKSTTIETTRILGGRFRKLIPSKDGKHLFAITQTTGFKIISMQKDGSFKTISNILRTKSKLKIKPHYIGPVDGKPPKHGTPYDYDSPQHIAVTRDESRAYISDINHGLYVVDIENKKAPKIIAIAENLKCASFTLSQDESKLLFYKSGNIVEVEVADLAKKANENCNKSNYYNGIELSKDGKLIIVKNRSDLLLYNANTFELLTQYSISNYRSIRDVSLSDDGYIYLLTSYHDIELLKLDSDYRVSFVTSLHRDDFIDHILPLPKENKFCYGGKKGVTCLDISDKLNPKEIAKYKNNTLGSSQTMSLSYNKQKLIIAYSSTSLGSVELEE